MGLRRSCRGRDGDDENERTQLVLRRQVETLHELVAIFNRQEGIEEVDFGNPGQGAAYDVFDAGLGSRRHGDRVAVASQSGGNPEDIDFGDRRLSSTASFSIRHFVLPFDPVCFTTYDCRPQNYPFDPPYLTLIQIQWTPGSAVLALSSGRSRPRLDRITQSCAGGCVRLQDDYL